jgi:hypothetical protein
LSTKDCTRQQTAPPARESASPPGAAGPIYGRGTAAPEDDAQEKKMKRQVKWAWAALATAALGLFGSSAHALAGNPSYLNIDVTINAQVSVAVNGVNSSTITALTWNTNSANQEFTAGAQGSSVTVRNDSNVTEKWFLSGSTNSVNTSGSSSVSWTLQGSTAPALPGADAYALQAVFGSTNTAIAGCPGNGSSDWNNGNAAPALTGVPAQYTDVRFADSSLTTGGGPFAPSTGTGANAKMFPSHARALCWRVIMPGTSSTVDPQNIQLVVTAGN